MKVAKNSVINMPEVTTGTGALAPLRLAATHEIASLTWAKRRDLSGRFVSGFQTSPRKVRSQRQRLTSYAGQSFSCQTITPGWFVFCHLGFMRIPWGSVLADPKSIGAPPLRHEFPSTPRVQP